MRKTIQLGDKVELVTELSLTGQQDKYYSKVQEVAGENQIVITAPLESGRIVPLEMNRKYGMCVYTNKGLYRCEVVVSKRSKNDKLYLITLDILTTLQKYQRRQFYRMDCMLNFHYKDDAEDSWQEGLILDISGGGIRFTSKSKLENDKGLINHLRLDMGQLDKETELFLSGMIIESSPTELDPTVYENRVEFDQIDSYEREIIIKFIFEEQRKRRQHRKG